ncbi:sodium channel protein Nach [Chrysoperla carnea]|uniref:sodium channel protein Nach n=1 Tax=Chrysoperla carnea TaxID=189513 RepID=UPI001D088C70|nr:sodium channel protein Nach [Chrysoperla carnea]
MVLKRLLNVVRSFLLFSNVHGFSYVADREIHWIGRLFWLTCIVVCYIASYFLIKASYENYEYNSISFVMDTAYLEWETNFPAIIVCEVEGDRAEELALEIYGKGGGSPYSPDLFNEIGFFRGTASLIKDQCTEEENFEPCNINFTFISDKLRKNCTSLFRECFWNDVKIDCCKYFLPLQTEVGLCYAVNSLQTGKEEMPSLQIPDYQFKTLTGAKREYIVSIKETKNEPAVRNIAMKHRKCRYPDENYTKHQKYYSLFGCVIDERIRQHHKLCNCTHHLMANAKKICKLEGLLCISKHFDDLTVIKPKWSKKQGLAVDCLPSCVEDEVDVIHVKNNLRLDKTEYGEIIVSMNEWPTVRFKRTVVRDKLDLIVSIGGTVGLFIGASVLSIVEIFYYFGFRIWFNTNTQDFPETNVQQVGNTNKVQPMQPDVIRVGYKLATNKDNEIILIKTKDPNEKTNTTPTYSFSYHE